MVSSKQSSINFSLALFQTSACHVGFPHCFNLLKTVLLTERIKGVIDSVKQFNEFTSCILRNQLVKIVTVYENDSNFALLFWEVLLAILDSLADEGRNQNIYDWLQLLQILYLSKLSDETHLLVNFVPIGVVGPEKDVDGDNRSLPKYLNAIILDSLSFCFFLNRGNTDVQEAHCWEETSHRNEEDWV